MSFITTCPQCRTSFRIVTDQLKLRGGLVRCGACSAVFSALDALRRSGEASAVVSGSTQPRWPPVDSELDMGPEDYAPYRVGSGHYAPAAEAALDIDRGADTDADPDTDAVDDLETGRARIATNSAPGAEFEDRPPGPESELTGRYIPSDGGAPDLAGRNDSLMLAAIMIASMAILLQAVIISRDWLAARFPALEPAIASLVVPLGVEIALPRSLASVSIESFDLQAAGKLGIFSASAILRNDASHAVRWPSMLLTLTDAGNRVLVRRIIDPQDYLGQSPGDTGLRPRSERPVRLALQAQDLQPAGYSVVLFYR